VLHGGHRAKSVVTLKASASKRLARGDDPNRPGNEVVKGGSSGFGGHFRAVQGFRYCGEAAKRAAGERRGAC
jgi:hypothetical protein